jgi:myosin heavy subunit
MEEQKPTNNKQAKASVTTKFNDELTILVDTLASAEKHYVRCIKPNDEKKSLSFDSTKVLSQLACNGVFVTVTLRKAGFSDRMEFSAFIDNCPR